MAETKLTPQDFTPLHSEREVQSLSRPSLSYWQDAWIRLKANRRALISLYIVIFLLTFTVAGPWFWTIDPSAIDSDQISQAPGANRDVYITAPYQPWTTESIAVPASGMALIGEPTTQSVRMAWAPVPGAFGYRVYRNHFPVDPGKALGLPLVDILNPTETWFEDRLDLKARDYYYAVVGTDAVGHRISEPMSVDALPQRVITASEAIRRGIASADEPPEIGTPLKLKLHPLGTDYLGRDMLSRLMHGARVSLFIGIFAPFAYVILGIAYGAMAGFLGGVVDQFMMRFADFVVALPFLLFMIVFKLAFSVGAGESGIFAMLVAMIVLLWPGTARLVRGQILQIREEGYVSAAKLMGATTNYLVLRHMIPNTMGVILVTLTFAVPSAIFTEAFLSFIGMGVAPPTPSWGSMCNEGIKTMLTTPHELLFPAALISVTVLVFNLLGDGLRDALDARMRSRE